MRVERKETCCKVCGKLVFKREVEIARSKSLMNGCCSYKCFRQTPEGIAHRKSADEKRVEKIRQKYGPDAFSMKGKESKITRARNFLKQKNISICDLSNNEIVSLWQEKFDSAEHGKKVSDGFREIHGAKSPRVRRLALVKGACHKLGMNLEHVLSMIPSEQNKIVMKARPDFTVAGKVNRWKMTHLVNAGIIDASIEHLSEDDVDRLYSEYLSNRYRRESLECMTNGYLRSKKGWYRYVSCDFCSFYRSSWELEVFKVLDNLCAQGYLNPINPDRIDYYWERKRHYYPDAAFEAEGKRFVIEVKPESKITLDMNKAKFDAARSRLENNFLIITETHIFDTSRTLEEYIVNKITQSTTTGDNFE
jgi:hypothetical protein